MVKMLLISREFVFVVEIFHMFEYLFVGSFFFELV
jgi:hypothetical protein